MYWELQPAQHNQSVDVSQSIMGLTRWDFIKNQQLAKMCSVEHMDGEVNLMSGLAEKLCLVLATGNLWLNAI
jgi:hypothetical protein